MEYIISDTHFLHDNIWLYDLSRILIAYNQIIMMSRNQLHDAKINDANEYISLLKPMIPVVENSHKETLPNNIELSLSNNKQLLKDVGDKLMIYNWNKAINKSDIIYHLGDLSMASTSEYDNIANILSQLNGRIKLILGNHDNRQLINKLANNNYLEILTDAAYRIKYNHRIYFLSHYGMDIGNYTQLSNYVAKYNTLPKSTTVSIHGHIHEDDYPESYKFNVSDDNKLSYTLNNNHLGQPILFSKLDDYISHKLLTDLQQNN